MNMDFSPVTGGAALLAGVAVLACLPRAMARPVWLLAGIIILATVGRNFYAYPPFNDGAYFQLRYGAFDGFWPAGPKATMLGLAVIAIAAEAVLWPLRRALGHWLLTVVAVGACCFAYEWFTLLVDAGSGSWVWLVPALCIVAATAASLSRNPIARLIRCQAAMLLLTCLATWLLYWLPLQ